MRGYDDVKAAAKRAGLRIPDLLVLARGNDPFFAGAPAERAKGEWFAALWQRFDYRAGIHLRRVHYQLLSHPDPRKHDGTPYENSEGCWDYLNTASKAARYLGLVRPDAFEDHRNPDPHILAPGAATEKEPAWWPGSATQL